MNLNIRLCLLQQTLLSRQETLFLAEIPYLDAEISTFVLQDKQLVSNKLIVVGEIYVLLTKAFSDQVWVLITIQRTLNFG